MTEKELMLAGQLYMANDEELMADNRRARKLLREFNASEKEQRVGLLRELFEQVGENPWVEPPFYCDYGCHIRVGNNFYANFDCIILDVCDVVIGDNVLLGPRVSIFTAGHPIDAAVRGSGLEYGKKVVIGSNVWIGGNTVINPGVHIGDNVVIGSGAVITKDVPSGVIAVGNPGRILREITEQDKIYWEAQASRYRENKKACGIAETAGM